MKKCFACGQAKPVSCFSKNSCQKDGLNTHCKECVRAYLKSYYEKNKGKWQAAEHKENRKRRYLANIEYSRQKGREYQASSIARKRDLVGSKECLRCHQVKSSQDFARRRLAGGDGLKDYCKSCCLKMRTELKRANFIPEPIPKEKPCSCCGVIKPIGDFSRHNGCKFGLSPKCKVCTNKKRTEYFRKNPERKLARDRIFRAKNPDKLREYARRYQERFPAKVKARKRAGHIRRKCRLQQVGGAGYTGTDILELMQAQDSKCVACGVGISAKYHVDHIIPIARGGTNDKSNIQLLCPFCNMSKKDKTMVEFLEYRASRRKACLQENKSCLTA